MLKFENKEFRNLQEQVLKNAIDIKDILEGEQVLNQFGIKVIGQIETTRELPAVDEFTGEYGDAYAVGISAPYNLYIWTRNVEDNNDGWFNIGLFPKAGPKGPQGIQGIQGPKGDHGNSIFTYNKAAPISIMTLEQITANGWKSGDTYLNALSGDVWVLEYNSSLYGYTWVLKGNIRGPQGIQGIQGPKGDIGPQGPIGPTGPQGDPGDIIKIIDILAYTNELPSPTTVEHSIGYLVGTSAPYHLYIIIGETQATQQWFDTGTFGDFELVNITVPLKTTHGTLTADQLSILQNSPYNIINLNGEYFRLNDDKNNDGYLVYSHLGTILNSNNDIYSKLLVITISTRNWVLTENRLATYENDIANRKSLIISNSENGNSVSYDTTVSDVELIFNSSDFYSYVIEDENLNKRKFLVELVNPTGAIEEIQQWEFNTETFRKFNSQEQLEKTVLDITQSYNGSNWNVFYEYIRTSLLGLNSSAVLAYFLSDSYISTNLPSNFKTFINAGNIVSEDVDSFKVECVGAYINITVWTRSAKEFELVMFNGNANTVSSGWHEKASKAYIDGLIGDINTVLDTINGEVI